MSITVKNAKVTVNAPAFASHKIIEQFVDSKQSWISRHLKAQESQENKKNNFNTDYGSDILYLGQLLNIKPAKVTEAVAAGGRLNVPFDLEPSELKRMVKKFYKKEAEKIIREIAEYYSEVMGIRPAKIKITEARTRWGSCSGKGNVNFSWYLIMAPKEQIEYVVVHELAHLKEMNHSKNFWRIVEEYIPDHKERRMILKTLNRRLLTENWDTAADI